MCPSAISKTLCWCYCCWWTCLPNSEVLPLRGTWMDGTYPCDPVQPVHHWRRGTFFCVEGRISCSSSFSEKYWAHSHTTLKFSFQRSIGVYSIHTRAHFFPLSLTSSSHHLNFGWDPARALRLGCKWNVAPHTSSKVLFVPWVIPGCAQSSHRAPSLGSPQLLPYGKGRYCCCTRVICNSVFSSSSTAVIVQL